MQGKCNRLVATLFRGAIPHGHVLTSLLYWAPFIWVLDFCAVSSIKTFVFFLRIWSFLLKNIKAQLNHLKSLFHSYTSRIEQFSMKWKIYRNETYIWKRLQTIIKNCYVKRCLKLIWHNKDSLPIYWALTLSQ